MSIKKTKDAFREEINASQKTKDELPTEFKAFFYVCIDRKNTAQMI